MLFLIAILSLIVFLLVCFLIFHLIFGKNPKGESLEKIKKSKHWNGRRFKNLVPTQMITLPKKEGSDSLWVIVKELFLVKNKNPKKVPTRCFDKKNLKMVILSGLVIQQ